MKLTEIKPNKNNPRQIKTQQFNKLVKSIREFPKMMELRPIIVDSETKEILGGNMRYKAIIKLGYKEIPDNWIKYTNDITEEEKQRFIIEDNVSFGDWDLLELNENWNDKPLSDWGLDLPEIKVKDEDDFINKFNKINDQNCTYPLVPKFDEKNEIFIIVSNSEIDSNWLREKLGMQKMKSYKSGETSKSNIISIEDIKNVL